jgi:putative acetyltransferase
MPDVSAGRDPSSPEGLRLRAATLADVPVLAAIYVRCALELGPRVYTPQQVAAWAAFGSDAAGFADYVLKAQTRVALDAHGEALGFCGFSLHEGVAEVHSLYVRPDRAGQGLGSALLADGLRRAREAGATRFEAWATPFSRPLFARAGLPLKEAVRGEFKGVVFERYRMAG